MASVVFERGKCLLKLALLQHGGAASLHPDHDEHDGSAQHIR